MNIQDVAKRISPSPEERRQSQEVKLKVEGALRKIVANYNLIKKFVFGGSFAKDTWIAGHKEFDIFLVFSTKADKTQLEKQGLACGKKLAEALGGKQHLVYASHPYSFITLPNKYSIDLVPCYEINENNKIISAVDRSLLHVDFVKKAIKRKPSYATEIRLFKQFLKRFDLYGADDVIQGFSGYLAELLVIYFRGFENVIKAGSRMKYKEIISFVDFKKEEILQKFSNSCLIVIDPVDKNRNVAANLSFDVFDRFVLYSNFYLNASEKERFFFKKESKAPQLEDIIKMRSTYWVFLKIDLPKKDLPIKIYPKIRRLMKNISDAVSSFNFTCLTSWFFVENQQAILAFEFPYKNINYFERKIGPPLYEEKQVFAFLKAHKESALRFFTSEGRVCAELPRQHSDVSSLIALLLQQKRVGMSKDLSKAISSNNFGFIKESQLSKKCKAKLAIFLSNKFEDCA